MAMKIINTAVTKIVYANIFFSLAGLVLIAKLLPTIPPKTATQANTAALLGSR